MYLTEYINCLTYRDLFIRTPNAPIFYLQECKTPIFKIFFAISSTSLSYFVCTDTGASEGDYKWYPSVAFPQHSNIFQRKGMRQQPSLGRRGDIPRMEKHRTYRAFILSSQMSTARVLPRHRRWPGWPERRLETGTSSTTRTAARKRRNATAGTIGNRYHR